MAAKIIPARDTAANWSSLNPLLPEGVEARITDSIGLYKIGDGIHRWNDLPLLGEANQTPIVQLTSTTAQVQPNVFNKWGAVTSLNITLRSGNDGICNEYMLEFTVSGDDFSLSLPSDVRWANEPDWVSGNTYQVSILNNLAIGAEWEAAEA